MSSEAGVKPFAEEQQFKNSIRDAGTQGEYRREREGGREGGRERERERGKERLWVRFFFVQCFPQQHFPELEVKGEHCCVCIPVQSCGL